MIHPQAIIEPGAQLGNNVSVGPWTYIGNDVVIGDDCIIGSHVVIKGPTKIGKGNRIFQHGSIGEECQDKKYAGEDTRLVIGDNNVFRECVTVHRGTVQDQSLTQIGSNNLFMAYAHVAHDCMIGDNCIFANNATLAGHVHVGDWVIFGGMSGAHQFCHIGSHAFIAGGAIVLKDTPPFVMASGYPVSPFGLNTEGLKRRGFEKQDILAIRRAYKEVYRKGQTLVEAMPALNELAQESKHVQFFVDFINNSSRGIIR
ncbi:acyl-ACP--UDP-N-acetylglucosamine O-acyltransferase [Thalassotalea litorea]|uniref:Acyl-[acyl-carrier-protein]--UDP-N-acetylglucosamine O-acyltransferase n=1 Tax=Thalassotalea litorea TaxID=2020715 RepID=A0A5R9IWP9_9GAMM|nr:acyl-ACP--UDP-N-acetylglucosamine O-acyltransferase [Thalassotalea litorea]TLU67606.1 acyl-ACP--UDP-N-acetylglucosamine O-acyltransferase [Thalassotalea litorea]